MNKLLIADWLSGGGAEGLLVGDLANLSSCEPCDPCLPMDWGLKTDAEIRSDPDIQACSLIRSPQKP